MIVNTPGEIVQSGGSTLPEVTSADNGKVLKVVEGAWNKADNKATIEVIMGDLDRTYGTTAANYIGTFNSWVAIDNGKSFSDYDEMLLVCKMQSSPITGAEAIQTHSTNVKLLQHYDKVSEQYYLDASTYAKYGLDYTNNKFYLENFNYLCPIALVGIKY